MNQTEILTALGKLTPLYTDDTVTEIMVDAPDKVFVEKEGKIVDVDVQFNSNDEMLALIDGVLALGGMTLGPERTSGHILFPDGSRFVAVIPPTAQNGPNIVLRKTRAGSFDMPQLIKWNSVSQEEYDLLLSAIQTRQNILISGGTASGKTTFANILTNDIPDDERVIVVENIQEFQPRVKRYIRFAAENSPDHSIEDLIDLAIQMRPDRFIFGEFRGGEALHVLNLFNNGHDGSMATIHATNAENALARLETMCLMANLGLGLSEIRILISSAIQLITHQDYLPTGRRKVTQIVELQGLENGRYVLNPLFRYDPDTDTIESTGSKPSWK